MIPTDNKKIELLLSAFFCGHFWPKMNFFTNTEQVNGFFFPATSQLFISNHIHQDAKCNSQQFFY